MSQGSNTLLGWLSDSDIADAVSWRHHLHQHPELAFNEWRTSDFIAKQLISFGLTVHRGLAGTGVVGTISRGTSRRSIGIRADMDALRVCEQSGASYASSSPGTMHACGHDGHVATALAAARACAQLPDLDGTVHFIFQPAEENEGGGRRMVEEGLFKRYPCEAIYAMHNWPALPLGTCVARDDAMMAALANFEVIISGRGCHAAMPNEGIDPVLASCAFVASLQSIVSRNVSPQDAAVVSVTQIAAGDAWNIIPDTSMVRGTARWFAAHVGDLLERRLTDIANHVAAANGCTAEVRYEKRFPATINHPAIASFVREAVRADLPSLQVLDTPPSMGSEDFAFMLEAVPGCYIWLGSAQSENTAPLHSPRFDFNDALIRTGASLWISLVQRTLGSSQQAAG